MSRGAALTRGPAVARASRGDTEAAMASGGRAGAARRDGAPEAGRRRRATADRG